MPTYMRRKMNGATYFFTVVTHGRRPWFRSVAARRILGACFREARKSMPYEVDAVVLLPDHLHILMRPLDGVDYSALWRLVKTRFTQRVKLRLPDDDPARLGRRSGECSLWQRRFYEHTIRDEDDWGRHLDYIHFNPVKHGLVTTPSDWPWSSFHRYVRRGVLAANWPGDANTAFLDVPE